MSKAEDDVLALAKERFERCVEYYSRAREKARDDIRFTAASPDDPWQWEDSVRKDRKDQRRPCLTINKLPQHVRQVTNDMRQNRPSIRFRPADDKADPEVAEILMGVIRHIEANSDADTAYDTASEHQVMCGEGYIRVLSDYAAPNSFDQEICIKRVKNPFRVYLDPDIQCPAGSDARFGFVEERLREAEFKSQFPKADPIDWQGILGTGSWFEFGSEKTVLVVEYFEVVDKAATLHLWTSGATSFDGDPLPEGVVPGERPMKSRKAQRRSVVWRKLNGQEILEEKEFPGTYIPIARVVGNEWEVDGELITSGIVRNAKDSQRMYNVAQSAIVERVLQAPKTPWVAPIGALEGFEEVWRSANTANHAYLPWNHLDDQDQPIPPPVRVAPATVEPGLTAVAMAASEDIKAETGQYDASLGQRSNETSGRAIMARQREGDTSTYHYQDNLAKAVRHVGRIVLGMYPHVYDTRRVAQILGEDGESSAATLDPSQPQPLQKMRDDETGSIRRTFNPFVGTYDVYATTGPSYTTRRVEAVQAMTEMTQASPQLWGVIGDQLVKNMDWPGADDMAKRLKVTLVPEVRQMLDADDGAQQMPPQAQMVMQQLQQQLQSMQQALAQAKQIIDGKQVEAEAKVAAEQAKAAEAARVEIERLAVERYRAETERMRVNVDADTRKDVAAVGALTQLELAQRQPSTALAAELAEQPGE